MVSDLVLPLDIKSNVPLCRHDLSHPIFEGVFANNGEMYHIKSLQNFHLTKRADDHDPEEASSNMIIYRRSDTESLEKRHWRRKSGECAADDLIFNQIQSHRPPFTGFNKRDIPGYMRLGQAGLSPLSLSNLPSPGPPLSSRQLLGCPSSRLSKFLA
jgi:hypothetical protein